MNNILIQIPSRNIVEKKYIIDVIFKEFLGLNYCIEEKEEKNTEITIIGENSQKKLIIPEILFQTPPDRWLTPSSLPKQPLKRWKLPKFIIEKNKALPSELPIIFGETLPNDEYYSEEPEKINLGIDIFGSIFFMLTRYEEIVKKERDKFDRFPAYASLSYQEGFLEEPIVNEYLEILWICLQFLSSTLLRKSQKYQILLSHDVDDPFTLYRERLKPTIRSIAGDILHRKNLLLPIYRFLALFDKHFIDVKYDPYYTFNFIIETSKKRNLQSAFYFIAGHSGGLVDGKYSLDDCRIRNLMKNINKQSFEIGFHASYNTYKDFNQTKIEFDKLKDVCFKENIYQEIWGGRQHFLRWENPTTWQIWEDVGLNYDTTLSFADYAGFRCGTCYEYPVFNLLTHKSLKLRERPLIVMEGTLFGYMKLTSVDAFNKILDLSKKCCDYNGNFTLLWHNSNLFNNKQKRLYTKIINEITAYR